MENFTPVSGLIGGLLIGLSAALLLFFNGQVAGVSGIAGGLLNLHRGEWYWRVAFIAGLVLGPVLYQIFRPLEFTFQISSSMPLLAAGGLLVGLGVRMGGGCTSGHGVCGLSRISSRSIVATITFVAAAMATVYVVRHVLGGLT